MADRRGSESAGNPARVIPSSATATIESADDPALLAVQVAIVVESTIGSVRRHRCQGIVVRSVSVDLPCKNDEPLEKAMPTASDAQEVPATASVQSSVRHRP